MIINGEKVDFNDLLDNINWEDNKRIKVNDNINLTKYQISILKKNNINYESINSLNNLIYLINDVLNENDDEELEFVLEELSERNYYENTKK